jgi:hypothetical protein
MAVSVLVVKKLSVVNEKITTSTNKARTTNSSSNMRLIRLSKSLRLLEVFIVFQYNVLSD